MILTETEPACTMARHRGAPEASMIENCPCKHRRVRHPFGGIAGLVPLVVRKQCVGRGTVTCEAPPSKGPDRHRGAHKSGVHGVFGVAPGPEGTPLSPVGCPDWEEHRRQDPLRTFRRRRYQARIHASGAGFPELFISMSHSPSSRPIHSPTHSGTASPRHTTTPAFATRMRRASSPELS